MAATLHTESETAIFLMVYKLTSQLVRDSRRSQEAHTYIYHVDHTHSKDTVEITAKAQKLIL